MRQVIFDLDGEENVVLLIETDFDEEAIQEAVSQIHGELIESEDGWNESKIIDMLIQMKYIKIIGEAPEIYNINIY